MAVLYRTYRPQKFSEVIGQSFIIRTLQNAAKAEKLAHAYLLTGSRGVGKTTVARILAKVANCENLKDGDACLQCANCVAIANGTFLDLVEIDAASNTGVDNVRELIEHVRFQPSSGKFKVFIIDEVHMLSKGAFNALLKTLEEPPAHAIFILATTEIHKVPQTIVSRTQRFMFGRLSASDIETQLKAIAKQEKLSIEPEAITLIAGYSEGSLRDALSLLGKVSTLGSKITFADTAELLGVTNIQVSSDLVDLIVAKDTSALPAFFETQLEQGIDFTLFNKDFLDYLRLLLVFATSGMLEHAVFSTEQVETAKIQSAAFSTQGWMFVIRLFLRSLKEASISPLPELPMLLASIEACGGPGQKVVGQTSLGTQTAKSEPTPAPKVSSESVVAASDPVLVVAEAMVNNEPLDEISLSEVQAFWSSVVEKVRQKNSPLSTLLKNSPIDSVQKGVITVRVKYLFHKEHLENVKNQSMIQAVIREECGKGARVKANLVKEETNQKDSSEVIRDALQVFGGELVE